LSALEKSKKASPDILLCIRNTKPGPSVGYTSQTTFGNNVKYSVKRYSVRNYKIYTAMK